MISAKPSPAALTLVHSSDLHIDAGYTAKNNDGDGTVGLRSVLKGAVSLMRTGLSIGRMIPGLCRKLTPFGQRGGAIFFEGFVAVGMTF